MWGPRAAYRRVLGRCVSLISSNPYNEGLSLEYFEHLTPREHASEGLLCTRVRRPRSAVLNNPTVFPLDLTVPAAPKGRPFAFSFLIIFKNRGNIRPLFLNY